ncbi:SHOCT domain-containing protein [Sulfurovum sp. zt1-1]|uniref:SHOCT domain-containing protein n=1 Tax=Sulfurovum zhangzhouensis TaxID=3019067 RepID=A0ABT7QYZ0_9BACT|nr:SHOCT domain-containing protein [Sulfurovum zhangzhouensis]MDM5272058.1 SHOCT domain-containing protein [Sulfurovum zhangzhouensis]
MYPFGHCWGMGGWLVPIILLIILFYFLKEKQKRDTSSAQDILDHRYAKGEIDKEEYEERSKTLKKD